MDVISYILMGIGVAFMLIGVVGIFQTKRDFYFRILISSKIDTVGLMTLLLGIILRHGFSFFSGKIVLIMLIILILNPLVAHIMVRSAYLSGHGEDKVGKRGSYDN